MKISSVQAHNTKPSFGAKFFDSESLAQIAEYAVEHGKFAKLNRARLNIDTACLRTRLKVDIKQNESANHSLVFTRYVPKPTVIVPKSIADYIPVKVTVLNLGNKGNVLKAALEKLIKLGNSAPKNNLYKRIVINK